MKTVHNRVEKLVQKLQLREEELVALISLALFTNSQFSIGRLEKKIRIADMVEPSDSVAEECRKTRLAVFDALSAYYRFVLHSCRQF